MTCRRLPPWRSALAVVAHPDDESFGLGAVLTAFPGTARVAVLCLTLGEASTLHGVGGELRDIRAAELRDASQALRLDDVTLLDYGDGALAGAPEGALTAAVVAAPDRVQAEGLVVFDPSGVTGHPDHAAATAAALAAADQVGLPVLAWTLPDVVAVTLNVEFGTAFTGHPSSAIDIEVPVDRTRQRAAVACHQSQAVPGSVLWRRLELLGDVEHLRWVHDRRRDGRG